MCAKREPREVYQPVADLDAEVPKMIRGLVRGDDRPGGGSSAWVGAAAYYALLENV